MTVTTTTTYIKHTSNGTTATYSTGFQFMENKWVKVTVYDDTTAVGTVKKEIRDYTVAGANTGAAGTITFLAGKIPVSGDVIIIELDIPLTQNQDYVNGQGFANEILQHQLNKLTQIFQSIKTKVDLAAKISGLDTIASTNTEVPPLSLNAGEFLVINDAGTGFTTKTAAELLEANIVIVDTDAALTLNSDTRVATQKAAKTYIDNSANNTSWALIGSGSWSHLGTGSPASSAIEFPSGYNQYWIDYEYTYTSGTSANLHFQLSSDGSTFYTAASNYSIESSANYEYINLYIGSITSSSPRARGIQIFSYPRSSTIRTHVRTLSLQSTTSALTLNARPDVSFGSRKAETADTHFRFIVPSASAAATVTYKIYGATT